MIFGLEKLLRTNTGKIATLVFTALFSLSLAKYYKQILKPVHNLDVWHCSWCHRSLNGKKQDIKVQDYFTIIVDKDTTKIDFVRYFKNPDLITTNSYFRDATIHPDTTITFTGINLADIVKGQGQNLDSLIKNNPFVQVTSGDGYKTFYETKELFQTDTTSLISINLTELKKYSSPYDLIVAGKTANLWPHGVVEIFFK